MVKASLRTKSVGTKVSDEEFAALEARARAENLTLSEWVRARLLEPDAGNKVQYDPSKEQTTITPVKKDGSQ
jgi:hypothetical protein